MIKVINSNDSGAGSLRDAINLANLQPFAQILITCSVKTPIILTSGELVISTNLEIKNDNCNTLIQSTNSRIFHVLSTVPNLKLHNLTLIGTSVNNGGALYVESTGQVILKHVTIKDSHANLGGAIYTNGSLILFSSVISNNTAINQGAGIWAALSVTLRKTQIIYNQITSSLSSSGGAGIYVDDGNVILISSEVSYNNVNPIENGSAAGILVMNGNITIQDCSKINYNVAYNATAIQLGIGNIYIQNSQISHNVSLANTNPNGGIVSITVGCVYISSSEISCNTTIAMMATVVSVLGNVVVDKSKFFGNKAGGPGGGSIAVNFDASLLITNSEFYNNEGSSLGACFVNFSPTTTALISLTNCKIQNNTLTNTQTIEQTLSVFLSLFLTLFSNMTQQAQLNSGTGGQKFIDIIPLLTNKANEVNDLLQALPNVIGGFNRNQLIGGGVVATLLPCQVLINKCELLNNFAGKNVSESNTPFNAIGGAVFSLNAPVTIHKSIINNNKSKDLGGGIWNGSSLLITDSEIEKNKEGGVYNQGSATIIQSSINKNYNEESGGGIYNTQELIVLSSLIEKNSSKISGGGIYSNNLFTLEDTIVRCNSPDNVNITNPL